MSDGALPLGWTWSALGALVQKGRKITYGIVQPGMYVSDGVILVRGGDYSDGWAKIDEFKRVRPEIDRPYKRSKLLPGDLVLTIVGANTGNVAEVPSYLAGANITQTTARIAIDSCLADPRYILYLLRSDAGQHEVRRYIKGGAQPGLNLEDVELFNLSLPPPYEQRRIAAMLDVWDRAIGGAKALAGAKYQLVQALRSRMYAEFSPFKSDGPEPIRFGSLLTERVTKNNKYTSDDAITVGKYAIRKQTEHFSRNMTSVDVSAYSILLPGQFVYDPMSAYYGAIGRYEGDRAGIVSPVYRVLDLADDFDPLFVKYLLKSDYIAHQLATRSYEGNKEGKRRVLRREEFSEIVFRAPSLERQRQTGAALAVATRHAELAAVYVETLNMQKRMMTQKLVTGEWRLPEFDETMTKPPLAFAARSAP